MTHIFMQFSISIPIDDVRLKNLSITQLNSVEEYVENHIDMTHVLITKGFDSLMDEIEKCIGKWIESEL